MNERRIVALLGRQDTPTDAVEEYCRYLGAALHEHGIEMDITRVPWAERGWSTALHELHYKASSWRGRWVLLQYTALAWSARGFPLKFLQVVSAMRRAEAQVGVVYHDVEPFGGERVVDRVRRRVQLHTMRRAMLSSDVAIFTVPTEKLSWTTGQDSNCVFIPVGANLPVLAESSKNASDSRKGTPTVAVFGITGGEAGAQEISRIAYAVRLASRHVANFRLCVLGRNSSTAEKELRRVLSGVAVDLQVPGLLPANEVARVLSASDVLFFVRGPISSRRGSAIAGIACGLPIIAFPGPETASPVTEAGVVLVPPTDAELGEALVRVLTDQTYRLSLAEQSRVAYEKHFAWEAIANRYFKCLSNSSVSADWQPR
jgi:glycosyltransferase involved in cell wall biosynthesis